MKEHIQAILRYIGEDPNREGLRETPDRVIRSWGEIFSGYSQDPMDVMKTFEDGACDEMVVLKNISCWSNCEHHLLPFHGIAHIAYLPDKKIIGVSKLARLLEIFSRRLQVQERLTVQITDALMDGLKPKGAACVIEATHLCMSCRGVRQPEAILVTSSLRGCFRDESSTRSEFFRLIGK